MRDAFSNALVESARNNPKVLLLTGDHGYALFDGFRRHCPKQYINAGVAEQNMVGVAAGLARAGFKPVVYGLSAFVPVRVLEQIKLDVCHDDLPVTFIGDGAGFVYSHLGTSHQSTEDIACTRSIPGLTILSPADRFEMTACMKLVSRLNQPIYLRMGKSDLGDIHQEVPELRSGELLQVKSGSGLLAFIATGSMVRSAIDVAANYPDASVWSVPSIKPIDSRQVADICGKADSLVVMEEHSILGGLAAAIAEIASEHAPVKICRIGVNDRFSEYCGTYAYLLKEHQLDAASVRRRIDTFLNG